MTATVEQSAPLSPLDCLPLLTVLAFPPISCGSLSVTLAGIAHPPTICWQPRSPSHYPVPSAPGQQVPEILPPPVGPLPEAPQQSTIEVSTGPLRTPRWRANGPDPGSPPF